MNRDPERQLLKIGELAALAGISVKALRIYEKKNIIKPVEVDESSGYRFYSPDQLRLLESLIELQDMGFTLKEISVLLSGNRSKEEVASLFRKKGNGFTGDHLEDGGQDEGAGRHESKHRQGMGRKALSGDE